MLQMRRSRVRVSTEQYCNVFTHICVTLIFLIRMTKPRWAMVLILLIAFSSDAHAFETNAQEVLRRKAELRAALQAQKSAEQPNPQGTGSPPARQLSEQERANLRQQIRQQRL